MKTEAIGNVFAQALDGGLVGSHAAGNGDLFLTMLQSIFTSRLQNSQETGNTSYGNGTAVPGEKELTGKEETLGIDEWLAFAATDYRFANMLNVSTAAKEQPELSEFEAAVAGPVTDTGIARDIKTVKENQDFSSILKQWEDLSFEAKEIARLIISGLLNGTAMQEGEQAIPAWLTELNILAAADSTVDSSKTQLQGNNALLTMEVLSGQNGNQVGVAKIVGSAKKEQSLPKEGLQLKPGLQTEQKTNQTTELKTGQPMELKPEQQLTQKQPFQVEPELHMGQKTIQTAELKSDQLMELKSEQQPEQTNKLQAAALNPEQYMEPKLENPEQQLAQKQPSQLEPEVRTGQKTIQAVELKSDQPTELKPEQQPQQKQLLQMEPELQPAQKVNTLAQQLLDRLGAVTNSNEELDILEHHLASGAVPLLSEKGLSTQTVALIASYLQEGKPLGEMAPAILSGLHEHFTGMEIPDEGKVEGTTEKARPFAVLLARVEKFINNLLTAGREGMSGVTGKFGDLTGEQFKGAALPHNPDSLAVLSENDSGRMNAALGGRTEIAMGTRIFSSPAPAFQPNEVMAQVMERLAMLSRPGVQELRMQLHPENLGNLLIKLRNVRGVLSAEIFTQHVAVKELLEGQLDTLRQRFQDMNVQIEEFRVLVGDEEQQKRGEAGDSDKNPNINAAGLKKNKDLQHANAPELRQRNMEQHLVDYLA